ncbi:glycosyltransferase family 2 protein [Nocardioides nanhaiensis]
MTSWLPGRSRRAPLVSVVVPVYRVERYLASCLDTVLASTHANLDVVVVDDGSPDASGEIAEEFARRDPRVRVVHTENRGLGAARNEGVRHARGEYLAFADSDDLVPPAAYEVMLRQARRAGCDFVTGSITRWEGEERVTPPWMRRLHRQRAALLIEQEPELLGDVFAWNKLFRRDFYDGVGLAWPEGVRYEDQPTTTRAYLAARRFGVLPDVVYVWRIRADGSSITQQRASLADLEDRWTTKRMALASVREHGSDRVSKVFHDRVLAGDLHRYFTAIPGCDDDWWRLLQAGVAEMWAERSLTHSGLPPVHRLTGWLVEQDRRDDAAAVMSWVADLGGPAPRVTDREGRVVLAVPPEVLAPGSVPHAALAVRDTEH